MRTPTKLDLVQLKKELLEMNYWNPIYKIVKVVGTEKGWWKNQPRGNPKKGYANSRNKPKEF